MLLLVSAGVWHCVECMQYHYVCTVYSICTIVLCNMFVLLCKMLVLWAAVVAYRIQMSFCTLFHDIALCKSSPCWEGIVELSNVALVLPSIPLYVCSLLGVHFHHSLTLLACVLSELCTFILPSLAISICH